MRRLLIFIFLFIGTFYLVIKKYILAEKFYQKAADRGSATGQNDLGYLYMNGYGVPQDYTMAAKLFPKAADQGHAAGLNNLGLLYIKGQGVPQNQEKGCELLRQAADKDAKFAQDYTTHCAAKSRDL